MWELYWVWYGLSVCSWGWEKYCRTTCCNTILKLCSVEICVVLLMQYCLPSGELVCFMLSGWIILDTLDGFFKERFGLVLVPWLSWLERCFRACVVRFVTGSNPFQPPHVSFENECSNKKFTNLHRWPLHFLRYSEKHCCYVIKWERQLFLSNSLSSPKDLWAFFSAYYFLWWVCEYLLFYCSFN